MIQYPIASQLHANPAVNCAALVITENFEAGSKYILPAQPKAELRNGTITFVQSQGRFYGITCFHVVEHFRKMEKKGGAGSHSMRTMLNGFYVVIDRFIQPPAQYPDASPDIAIREVKPGFISHLGKQAIDIDVMKDVPDGIRHAYAVGFPEALKTAFNDKIGYRVSMPQAQILAELQATPTRRFSMFSEIEPVHDIDYSGMSGGPIFWSTEEEYGLVGIIYEGGHGSSGANDQIFVYGELATPEIILGWIDQCLSAR